MDSEINKSEIGITDKVVNTWQSIVNTIAEIINVPSALIMKVDEPYIEVFRSSQSSKNQFNEAVGILHDKSKVVYTLLFLCFGNEIGNWKLEIGKIQKCRWVT